MSKLIDSALSNMTVVNDIWYIAKPLGVRKLRYRIVEAWKVLCGKAETFHYKEDEL